MTKLNPDKLYVEFRSGTTMTEPVMGRRYTLTHSDVTADLFLTISLQFAYDKLNAMRDEVLAEWRTNKGHPFLWVYVYVDGQADPKVAAIRDKIFRENLPLALEAIRYGDRKFFMAHPKLGKAPICIHFDSNIPEYNKYENWGTPNNYK